MAELRQNLNLSQRQTLAIQPAMLQLVKFLQLNQLELKDALVEELKENPALEELESGSLTEAEETDERRDRAAERIAADTKESTTPTTEEAKDPFDDIDLNAWEAYMDTGYRSPREMETIELPTFESIITKPTNLSDHLLWQLHSLSLRPEVLAAAEEIIGNLDENGRLTATDEELLGVVAALPGEPKTLAAAAAEEAESHDISKATTEEIPVRSILSGMPQEEQPQERNFTLEDLQEARKVVQELDPAGVGARDLQECLLLQLVVRQNLLHGLGDTDDSVQEDANPIVTDAQTIIEHHWQELQKAKFKEIAKAMGRSIDAVMAARDLIRKLDPTPGLRFKSSEPRIVEPDVYILKIGSDYVLQMNDESLPQLRINPAYYSLRSKESEKETRNYVKERYRSAEQLIKNIEQRRQTILRVCHSVVERQLEFLDHGLDQLRPMMIKEVAEEIGVHPSTVSRAVDGKYVHTPQGVFELRYFFSESVGGDNAGSIPLIVAKRRVKKMIDEEDPAQPLTDDQLSDMLRFEGISVTRRTVAKYRDDLRIPSTHQRRRKT